MMRRVLSEFPSVFFLLLVALTLPAMADDNQLSPGIEDRCKGWTRDSENWRQCVNDELEARRKAVDAQIEASSKDIAAKKVHLMRVDCSLIQGAQRIGLLAGPRLSAERVAEVKCGEEVIARSNQDGWTKVLRQIGESPQWIEGYIGSSLLVEIPLPNLPNYPPKIHADDVGREEIERARSTTSESFHVGAGVTAPRALYTPDAEYTVEARNAKYQGVVVLWVIVGPDGRPTDIRITRPLGMGLGQKAMEAVSRWLFEPATKDGKPVAVQINVEMNFRLY